MKPIERSSPCGQRLLLVAAMLICLMACLSPVSQAFAKDTTKLAPFDEADVPPEPDYEDASSWLALPDDPDRFGIDIIWVYPTVLFDQSAWLMDIARKDLVAAAQVSIDSEARIFSGQANLYAPLYRQMNLSGFYLPEEKRDAIVAYGENDVRRALAYYFKHYNKGRPFILAGHSQGSYVLTQLLVDDWGKTGVEDRLIAGYIVGWSLTGEDLKDNSAIRICDQPHQINCFVSYNSVAPGKQANSPVILPGAIVVNPVTWTRGTGLADAKLNRGSTFLNKDKTLEVIPGFASAQIADGGLEVVAEDPARVETPFFPPGVYHSYDYSLFYDNISMNVAQRAQAYLAAKQAK